MKFVIRELKIIILIFFTLFYIVIVGICDYNFYIDENGDAEANYTVVSLQPDQSGTEYDHSMQSIGYFWDSGDVLPVNIQSLVFNIAT